MPFAPLERSEKKGTVPLKASEISFFWRAALFRLTVAELVRVQVLRSLTTSVTSKKGAPYMTPGGAKGIVDIPSNHSMDQTVEKLKHILQAKGVTLFALIDHSGEAEKAGLKMRPTKLLIFGSPKAGTPVMLEAPSSAIDLPLKILIWEDARGKVWVTYNSPEYLQERHGVPEGLVPNIAAVRTLAAKTAE